MTEFWPHQSLKSKEFIRDKDLMRNHNTLGPKFVRMTLLEQKVKIRQLMIY